MSEHSKVRSKLVPVLLFQVVLHVFHKLVEHVAESFPRESGLTVDDTGLQILVVLQRIVRVNTREGGIYLCMC